jgi:hypothetical protein
MYKENATVAAAAAKAATTDALTVMTATDCVWGGVKGAWCDKSRCDIDLNIRDVFTQLDLTDAGKADRPLLISARNFIS